MPIVPGTRFIDRPPSVSSPAQNPLTVPIGALTAPAEALRGFGKAGMDFTESLSRIQTIEDTSTAQDAINAYHQRSREYVEGAKAKVGVNAVGLSKIAEGDLGGDYISTLDSLPNENVKKIFKAHAFSIKESYMTAVASHELSQLEKYRTDTVNAAFQNAAEDIKLSTGDPRIVESVIDSYEAQVESLYPGQDTSQMKLQHRALLQKAGREAQDRYAQTAAFDIVRSKFTKPDASGNPVMDYAAAKDYLLDNPDKVPEISHLTIEQRGNLANLIWSDGVRSREMKQIAQADEAGNMWASYDKLLRGEKMGSGDPQTLVEWHRQAELLTRTGAIPESVLKTAISYTKAEMIQEKQEKAAIALEKSKAITAERAQAADIRARERFARETNPLIQSNLSVLSDMKARVLADPSSISAVEVIGMIGKGLSIKDAQDITAMIKGAPAKLWESPTGSTVKKILNDYRKNYEFGTDDVVNNAGYSDAVAYFQEWMKRNPNASAEDADKEMRRYMYPVIRGKFGKVWDRIVGDEPILSKED